jgi:large subunit ribosomal protein L30e
MAEIDDIKKLLKSKNLILGTERTLKNLRIGKLSKVYCSSNCPGQLKADLKYYGELSNTPIIELEQTNEEIGILCKKPFFISVLSVAK